MAERDPGVTSSVFAGPGGELSDGPGIRTTGRWFLLSSIVGLVAGCGAILFFLLSDWLFHYVMGGLAGYHPVAPRGEGGPEALQAVYDYAAPTIQPLLCVLLPALGGLIVGWLVFTYAPDAKGHGTDAAVEAYHLKRGRIHPRVIWVKALASAITLGTGGSGGREGPIAQIGAGFGSWLAGMLKLSYRERRVLLACGMGAGVAAIFRAPLAGALFAAEILYSRAEFESEVIMPAIVSCIVSYSVFTIPFGHGSLFAADLVDNAQHLVSESPLELLPYTVLGVVLSALIWIYVRFFYGTEAFFDRLKIKPHFKPMIGGALCGATALLLYEITQDGRSLNLLAFGYGAIQEAFDLDVVEAAAPATGIPWALVGMFMLVALGKIVTTSFTIGSGGSAGVFGPSMVIGGAAGGAVGVFFHYAWPGVAPHPGAFAIVGMAGFFTGAAHVPISTLIMVSEITGNYSLLLPAMWVEAITFTLCYRVSLYRAQVPSRKDSPAHRGDFIIDLLGGLTVESVKDKIRKPVTVRATDRLREIVRVMEESTSHYFPVLDGDEKMVGILSTNDFRRYLHNEGVWDLIVAADIMTPSVLTVTLENDLHTVMRRITQKNIDAIPVVSAHDDREVLGMLRRREVIAIYNERFSMAEEEIKEAMGDVGVKSEEIRPGRVRAPRPPEPR